MKPFEIKILNIKNIKFENQTIYLLYFTNENKTQLSELKKIRSLFHMIVKFDYFKNKNNGPTQCANCQLFGHGQENCFKLPKCMRCGEGHKSSECIHLQSVADGKKKIPDDKLKCVNCGQKHTSCSNDCRVRLDYIETRKKQQQHHQRNNNKTHKRSNPGFIDAPELRNFNFPTINPYQRATTKAWQNQHAAPKTNNNNDLFTPEECHSILMDLVTNLMKCNSKLEQFSAISQIAQKYMCP